MAQLKESHYNINVAKLNVPNPKIGTYHHFFDVDCVQKNEAMRVFKSLREQYPLPEYNISVTYWNCSGKQLDWENDNDDND